MKAKVAIGITTYLDIASPDFGEAVFNAYAAASQRIIPNQISVWSTKYAVTNAADFAERWLTRGKGELRADRGRGEVIERWEDHIGGEWRRVGPLVGSGRVDFRPENDSSRSSSLLIEHSHAAGVDWESLFHTLIARFRPSYGMLHLFSDQELSASGSGEQFARFDGPFAGEEHFVSWKSAIGDWRQPDKWELAQRRAYRFLPQLSWANYLGREFDGRYDSEFLVSHSAVSKSTEDGLFFQVTAALGDVERDYVKFDQSRALLKSAFAADFFRIADPTN